MFRKATYDDLNRIMNIIENVINDMQLCENDQWDYSYPLKSDFRIDINNDELYVLEDNNTLKGFICINKKQADEYNNLTWSHNSEAFVIHRMAVNPNCSNNGIGVLLINFAEQLAIKSNINYIKVDTYCLNKKAQNLFIKCNYNYIGTVNFPRKEKEFCCYDKILE